MLLVACYNGSEQLATLLVQHGADVETTDGPSEQTALMLATYRLMYTTVVELLRRGADVHRVDKGVC